VIDKRITPRFISYERADLWLGIVVVVIGAVAMMAFTAAAFEGQPEFGNFTGADAVASGLAARAPAVGLLFAIALIDASIIGAAAVSLSTAYALGDVLSIRHSLHRKPKEAKGFYAFYATLNVIAAAIVLSPNAPLGLLTNTVQTLAGVLLPSAAVFLLLLCNDKAVLRPWTNSRAMNLFTGGVIAALVILSVILTASVLFPDQTNETVILAILGCGTALAALAAIVSGTVKSAGPATLGQRGWGGGRELADAPAIPIAAGSIVPSKPALDGRFARLFGARWRARADPNLFRSHLILKGRFSKPLAISGTAMGFVHRFDWNHLLDLSLRVSVAFVDQP
jgi:hypothetical protein